MCQHFIDNHEWLLIQLHYALNSFTACGTTWAAGQLLYIEQTHQTGSQMQTSTFCHICLLFHIYFDFLHEDIFAPAERTGESHRRVLH